MIHRKIIRNSVGWSCLVWDREEWQFIVIHENGYIKDISVPQEQEADKSKAIDALVKQLTDRSFKYQKELQLDLPVSGETVL